MLTTTPHSFPLQIVPQTEVVDAPITFGDLRSAGNCHEECVGCSESYSAIACFSCKHFTQTLRNRAGVKCVTHCDSGYYADGDKCRRCSVHCESCTRAEQCDTCHGAKLLVEADHIGHHFDHGRCVDACPAGLVADYTNLLQARCVLKRNPCSAGYYENMRGVCVECDAACSTCHGAGTLQCDSCSQGYGNRTVGYCRPCCPPLASVNTSSTMLPERQVFLYECEPCDADADADADSFVHRSYAAGGEEREESLGRTMFTMTLVFLVLCLACAFAQFFCVQWNNGLSVVGSAIGRSGGGASGTMEYTPLRNIVDDESEHRHHRKPSSPFAYRSDNDASSSEGEADGVLSDVRSSGGRVRAARAEQENLRIFL